MKAKSFTFTISVFCVAVGFAQSSGVSADPVILEKSRQANALSQQSYSAYREKDWSKTIETATSAIVLYREVDAYPDSFFYGRLANAYVQISDFSKAGESFRNMTRLEDPRYGENLSHDISINPHFTVSYIEFLANQGREADAKAVYYALLRYHSVPSPSPDMGKEPFPFLIVFDEDEYGDYWEYTRERVILAAKLATMRKMECYFFDYYAHTNRKHPELMEQAKSTFAGWYYPYAVDAIKDPLEIDETKVSQALSLAKSQKEREWINHGVEFVQASLLDRQNPNYIHINDGRAERRKMPILESSRIALMEDFDSVSCGKWGSKF